MEMAELNSNGRAWIMCVVSGVACIFGSSFVCVGLVVRLFPGQKHFRIEESNAFLACSLSLSFGVMIFSALYNMLPASERYLLKAGYSYEGARFVMMGCFVGGFIGIQLLSRLLHQLMPSHVVDCDHSHGDHAVEGPSEHDVRRKSHPGQLRRPSCKGGSHANEPPAKSLPYAEQNGLATESTPLLSTELEGNGRPDPPPQKDPAVGLDISRAVAHTHIASHDPNAATMAVHSHVHSTRSVQGHSIGTPSRRRSMMQVRNRVISFVKDTKSNCDESGPCYGYTDPCGQECFKHMSSRSALSRCPPVSLLRTTTGTWFSPASPFSTVTEGNEQAEANAGVSHQHHAGAVSPTYRTISRVQSRDANAPLDGEADERHHNHNVHHHNEDGHHNYYHHHDHDEEEVNGSACHDYSIAEDLEAQHHHHVPTNAFLSIGLQTVIAIALHKFPEGFITYATNIASPSLGFNVFMALLVHNIAEGFSMALPLYMALGSKLKAILWSSLLGGMSQPAGAGVAWLWLKMARRSAHVSIDNVAYAALFAVTAGIMTSVALQLFVESLSLNHSRNLSIGFAFLGMMVLGISSALVGDD